MFHKNIDSYGQNLACGVITPALHSAPVALFLALPFLAATLALLLAVAGLVRKRPSPAAWGFFAGMALFALDSACTGLALRATEAAVVDRWLTLGLVAKAALPVPWLAFSLIYSRGNYREFLRRWAAPLALVGLASLWLALFDREHLLAVRPAEPPAEGWWLSSGGVARALHALLLVALALVLTNLEQTFRSAVGTQRWRIKFVVLGLGVIVGAHVYVRSQAILFSVHDVALAGIESSALLVGGLLLAVAYARTGLAEIDVYPSLAILRSSFTALILGAYLLVVGVLAEVARALGGAASFQFQAFVVLLGMAGLAVLLLSDRLRHAIHRFAVRHFARAQHDSVRVWTLFSRRLASVRDEAGLCATAARLVSETFEVLAVRVWLHDERAPQLALAAATTRPAANGVAPAPPAPDAALVIGGLQGRAAPFDLEEVDAPWAAALRQASPGEFPNGGARWCVPLRAGDRVQGALVLADRVGGVRYSPEDQELLRCVADHVASLLVTLRMSDEVLRAREMEAFRTMSAFFVHDLKNSAASLRLMLNNLPVHFDDPDFRQDALRSVGNIARRIDEMIARLGALRQQPAFAPVPSDLNAIVSEAVEAMRASGDLAGVTTECRLAGGLPPVQADRAQLRSVVTNLVLNARDAVDGRGRVEVSTGPGAGEPVGEPGLPGRAGEGAPRVVLTVADDGCGMTAAFVRDQLFRPFQSTKKKGLGIGMYQARMVVEAHGGRIQVESEPGRGTTFRVSLPGGDGR